MKVPRLSILAAVSKNRVIGRDNALPWYLPEDLKHFKSLTMGHAIIMGRKTFESIGRPLPGRINIVVTKQTDFHADNTIVVHSLNEAITAVSSGGNTADDCECFVIGGAELYRQTIALSQRMYLTEIRRAYDGDTYFPDFDRSEWRELSRERHFSPDKAPSELPLEYHFVILERLPAKPTQSLV